MPAPERPGTCQNCQIACNSQTGGHKKKYSAYAGLWGLERHSQGFEDFVAAYHHLCNDLGLDAFETAGAIAVGLKAGRVRADVSGILEAVEEINQGTELGRVLGGGAEEAGRLWGFAPSAGGPRKNSGRPEALDVFLDSVGLCAFAYAEMPRNPELWAALEEMLTAKYGAAFDVENIREMRLAAFPEVMSKQT